MKPTHFIIIDDDPQDISLSKLYIKHALPGIQVIDFIKPDEGFEYIENYKYNDVAIHTVIFLDLNMPTMTGWEFLEKFDKLDEKLKEQFSVYITSSSIDNRDTEMAKANRYIKGYIVKPANVAVIKKIYDEIAEISL